MVRPAVLLIVATASVSFLAIASSTRSAATAGTPSTSVDDLVAWLDRRFVEHFQQEGAAPPSVVDDATYLRRVYLDLVGTIPSVSQVRDFLSDGASSKREMLIDRLLEDERYPPHLSRVWRRILIPGTGPQATMATQLDGWLEQQLAANVPYDEIVRRLVTAGGAALVSDRTHEANGSQDQWTPVVYLQATGGQPETMASSVSQVFLGVRLECAQCHDHPFTDWTQKDFWGLAAFFAGARLNNPARPDAENQGLVDESIARITPATVGKTFPARLLWAGDREVDIPEGKLPRQVFSEWLTAPENPHFAATAVNRVWQNFCGHGLTESVDDLDQATKEQRSIVLDELATLFAQNGFDLKWLIHGICRSKFYQRLSSGTPQAPTTLAERPLKVLTPEQLFDALEVALSLPISRIDEGPRYNGQREQIVARMSESLGQRPDDFRSGIPQALMLMNGQLTTEATDLETSRTLRAVVDAPFLKSYEKIDTLFLATLTRPPHASEMQRFLIYVDTQPDTARKRQAYSEIMWALINSPEFVLIR